MQPNKKTMSTPKISVIVPVYNAEKSLCRCIDSILTQTYQDFELLLINDGSKDSSGAICDSYAAKDSRIKVFHKSNGGVSSARNLGIDNAQGEWLTFVDADDWVEENFLSSFDLVENKGIDLIVGNYKVQGSSVSISQAGYDYPSGLGARHISNVKQQLKGRLADLSFIVSWGKLFLRSVVGDLRFDESLRLGEDCCFVYSCLYRVSKILFLSSDAASAYVYQSLQTGMIDKYRLTVQEASHHLITINKSYEHLGIEDVKREISLPETFFEYCRGDMLSHACVWYGNKEIERICLRRSSHLGLAAFLRTWVKFRIRGRWNTIMGGE